MKPVAWTGSGGDGVVDITQRLDIADQWTSDGLNVEPLVTLSAANAAIEERDKRIAELLKQRDEWKDMAAELKGLVEEWQAHAEAAEAENARHLAEIDRKSSMPGDYRYWEGRYRDEAARAATLEALVVEAGDVIARAQQNTPEHFSNWHEAARSVAAKIGARNGE